ncbi:hypothetical protein MRB53_022486 [Persea americana]|uniref:Uncharacterized protein n=1 Tax=Persea americana TaxID=3435 RepID=A0ACC2L717_PERAE|nr:hypothetical protein MRB53_022486 [Persea americana]
MKILKLDHELAEFVENECRRDSWKGIITRLWPNTKYIEVIVTGSMSKYIRTLYFYSNGLPLASTKYGSSECFCLVNLNPLCKPSEVSYTFIPTVAYFEFLQIHINNGVVGCISTLKSLNEKEKSDLVDLVDVELGKEYELSQHTLVTGFKNKAPQFNFVCRKNVVLSIDADKTNEVDLQNAVNNAIKHLEPFGASLIEYTSYADTSSFPGHYVLYWKLSIYKAIGPLEVKVVEMGTFDKLVDYALSRGALMNQYKTPLCVILTPAIELLNSRVLSNYFSPKIPWNGKQNILIDGFDGCAFLDFIRDSDSRVSRVQEKTEEEEELEEFVNFEHYRDLIKHRRRGFTDEEGLKYVNKELEAKAAAPFASDRSYTAQPPQTKG